MSENLPDIDNTRLDELMDEYGIALLVGSRRSLREIEQAVLTETVWKHFEHSEPIGVTFSMKEYIHLYESLGDDEDTLRILERALMRELG